MDENDSIVSEVERTDYKYLRSRRTGSGNFSDGYKMSVFELWYKVGKPNAKKLYNFVENDPITGSKPSVTGLTSWTKNDFYEEAEKLDLQVAAEMEGRLVQEKVEMLRRHTEVGLKMQ